MRPASSRMPARGRELGSLGWAGSLIALGLVGSLWAGWGAAVGGWQTALALFGAWVLIHALWCAVTGPIERRRYRQRAAERSGRSICTFGRCFDLRTIDPWIVRAVYEEFTDQARAFRFAPTVLPTDRLEEIIPDDEELTDAVADIAQRCRRELPARIAGIGPTSSLRELILWLNTHATCVGG